MPRSTPYRPLTVVYTLAILAGTVEYFRGPAQTDTAADIYGCEEGNYPEAMARLYPRRPETEYLLGRRLEAVAGRLFDPERAPRDPDRLPQVLAEFKSTLEQAARHYERALDLGLKSEELLQYNYALTLVRLHAEPARIDRAIADWRYHFPYSDRQDLAVRRRAIEKQLRRLPPDGPAGDGRHDGGAASPGDGASGLRSPATEEMEWTPLAGLVGSTVCRQCHAEQFESYLETAHSRSLVDVDPPGEPPDAVFDHPASGRRYRVARRDGRLTHAESLLLDDGTEFPLKSVPLRYRVGSGHFARTYLCEVPGGYLVESPVTWYESAGAWGMTPGFDRPGHRSFTRQILENCLWCHAGRYQMGASSNMRLRIVEQSIGCERCHGPGETHVARHSAGAAATDEPDSSIVNPRRLTRKLSEAVCRQCHLQGDIAIGGRGRRASQYLPGEPLEKFSTVYRTRPADGQMTVVGHVEQLAESACYRRSEALTCVTCHDPHASVAPAARAEHQRSVCLTCHASNACDLPLPAREKANDNCVECHMPKSTTEVPHVAFTHHRIGIHPLPDKPGAAVRAGPLVPLTDLTDLDGSDRERSLKLAQIQYYLGRGPAFQSSPEGQGLATGIDDWFSALPPDGLDVEIWFSRFQYAFARGAAKTAVQSAEDVLASPGLRSEEEAYIRERLGGLEFREKRFHEARAHYRRLVRLRSSPDDWYWLGICERECGRPEAAIRALEWAQQLDPAAVRVYEALAAAYDSHGDVAAATRARSEILQIERRLRKEAKSPLRLPE